MVAILGFVAAAITPQVISRFSSSKSKAALIQMENIASGLDMFYIDMQRYPSSDEGLQVLLTRPSEGEAWDGPYLRSLNSITDPWGNVFTYTPSPADDVDYRLSSLGRDNASGGDGEDGDLNFPILETQT